MAIRLSILTLAISGIEPVLQVSQRIDDGNLQARLVRRNGVNLIWAPDGPGWPTSTLSMLWYGWRTRHRAIQGEPVRARDKAFMGRLRYFGIEDGKLFEQFWSVTPYNEHTRGLIRSGIIQFIDANRDSRDERLEYNDDGSVDLYFGPDDSKVPAGRKANWLRTNSGEGWFPYFRLCAPKKEFFDKSWKLGDMERLRN